MSETNQNTSLTQAINDMRTMRESYNQLVEQNAQLATDVQAIKDAHILGFNYDGVVFSDAFHPLSPMDFYFNPSEVVEIRDNKTLDVKNLNVQSVFTNLEIAEFTAADTCTIRDVIKNSSKLRVLSIPEVVNYGSIYDWFSNLPKLQVLNILHIDAYLSSGVNFFSNDRELIDITYGLTVTRSTDLLRSWNPTTALENDSTSLLSDEDIAAGFTSNLEKLLWNIRNHIAANLNPEITASITFSAAVYAAIIADQDTVDAFPASWTIASV